MQENQPIENDDIPKSGNTGFDGFQGIEAKLEESAKDEENKYKQSGLSSKDIPTIKNDNDAERKASEKGFPCLSFEYWSKFFDITETEFKARFQATLNCPKPVLAIQLQNSTVDLYGPFWLATIFIFQLTIGSNLSDLLWSIFIKNESIDSHYDFNNIGWAISIVYFSQVQIPLMFWFFTRFFGSKIDLTKAFCIYGYSFSIYCIAGIFCIIPIEGLRYVVILLACVAATLSNFVNMHKCVLVVTDGYKIFSLVYFAIINILLSICYQYKFY